MRTDIAVFAEEPAKKDGCRAGAHHREKRKKGGGGGGLSGCVDERSR